MNLFKILGVFLFLAFASCSKEKTCECVSVTTISGIEPIRTTSTFVTEENCSSGNSTISTSVSGVSSTIRTTCSEK